MPTPYFSRRRFLAASLIALSPGEAASPSRIIDTHIHLYDPTAEPRAIAAQLAPRLTTLTGKRIGILDNGKANAGTLMLAVAKTLQERYGAGEIVKRDKPVAGPPSPETLEALAQCDLTLVGSAD